MQNTSSLNAASSKTALDDKFDADVKRFGTAVIFGLEAEAPASSDLEAIVTALGGVAASLVVTAATSVDGAYDSLHAMISGFTQVLQKAADLKEAGELEAMVGG